MLTLLPLIGIALPLVTAKLTDFNYPIPALQLITALVLLAVFCLSLLFRQRKDHDHADLA